MTEVTPAIIPESLEDLKAKLGTLRGLASVIQIDITDGMFVLSRSWPMHTSDKKGFEALVRGREGLPFKGEFSFELDCMVHAPEKILPDWVRLGITRAVFHLKSRHDFSEIKRIAGGAVELGVAVDLEPPYEKLTSYLPDIDYVQVMGIETLGKQGEPSSPRALDVVQRIKNDFPNVIIQVDGGVDVESAPALVVAGATRLVSGSYILKAENPRAAIEALRNI